MRASSQNHSSGRFIPGKEPSGPLNRKLGGLQGRSGRSGEERSLSTLPRFKRRFIQRVPGHHAEYRRTPTPHYFEPGLSGKAIDQTTVPIYRLPSSRDSRHKKSNVTESEKFNFRAHRHWRTLANIMGRERGKEGGHVDTGYCGASILRPVTRGFFIFLSFRKFDHAY
jgi:hypothetical protein